MVQIWDMAIGGGLLESMDTNWGELLEYGYYCMGWTIRENTLCELASTEP